MRSLWRRLALGLLIAVGIALIAVAWGWYGPGPATKSTTIIVRDGSTLTGLTQQLRASGLIRSGQLFRNALRLFASSDPIQSGEFEIPARASAASIVDLLQHGRPVQRLVTVTEGMPSIMVQERLAANQLLTGPTPSIPEGSVLPDSYSFERGESRAAVVNRMQAAMARTLDELLRQNKGNCPVASRTEIVTLASIVEKETGKASERRTVAGVYCNRLRIGMKLDADPTVIYPITKGKPLGRRILKSELEADNPYNTYRNAGLPPTPIANPGKASIAAVLHPAATKALYFVADGAGGHVFAETLAEQNANVAKYYALRKARGQM